MYEIWLHYCSNFQKICLKFLKTNLKLLLDQICSEYANNMQIEENSKHIQNMLVLIFNLFTWDIARIAPHFFWSIREKYAKSAV